MEPHPDDEWWKVEPDYSADLRRAWLIIAGIVIVCVLAVLAGLAWTTKARGHDWYPSECCSGQDCDRIEASAVKTPPDGYLVTLPAGGHSQVHEARQWLVPYADKRIRVSPDEHYHACIQPLGYMDEFVTGGEIVCLFVPGKLF